MSRRASMRIAPDGPDNRGSFRSWLTSQGFRQAGLPFRSSVFSSRKTRWVDFGKTVRRVVAYPATPSEPESNTASRLAMDQAIRANLLAKAQATTFECRRASIERTQSAIRPECLFRCSMKARAHWTSSRRMFLSPRLEMPSKFDRPPVLYWRGTSPTAAAKSRPHRYCFPSPSSEVSRLAVIGVIVGSGVRG